MFCKYLNDFKMFIMLIGQSTQFRSMYTFAWVFLLKLLLPLIQSTALTVIITDPYSVNLYSMNVLFLVSKNQDKKNSYKTFQKFYMYIVTLAVIILT